MDLPSNKIFLPAGHERASRRCAHLLDIVIAEPQSRVGKIVDVRRDDAASSDRTVAGSAINTGRLEYSIC